jgi:Nitrile hydratase beta subunit, C-terminal
VSAPFAPGEVVTVAGVHPPGHRRTPFYVRGKQGVIERFCGEFANPEELGYGFDGLPRKRLYRVRFRQKDLWDDYDGADGDTVDVDIYEHWLSRGRATVASEARRR